MYEVEIKVPVETGIRDRLAAIGAEPVERVHQTDAYFDAPHRAFAETDEALRIRRERVESRAVDGSASASGDEARIDETDARVRMTYKGPKIDARSKTRTEAEIAVDDAETARALLEGLGFERAATVEKNRHRFQIGGTTATVDDVAGLGTYLELERDVDGEAEIDSARDALEGTLADLGLNPDDQIRRSYLGLLLD
ncbi:class IV adenylate cyclase [Halococcoides cellulosivorans]|uniref:Class IV adenylate cyclase n=1 Tax=Halococcoides cellulosivorans TaxID=1679096 RepID=A0A2R4X1L4_9EURY|nr:class IV adenylate cyclase [Halococcoides cellulosivorans]AWB27671.1 class IV adenylate cyclase [Halococcoides cellulosivorans]